MKKVSYERNLSGSYMTAEAEEASLDEKILLKRKIPGLIAMKKCLVDGKGQYQYTITGMQAIDTIFSIRKVCNEDMEKLILQICMEVEILEKNLVSADCLMVDSEMIYVDNQTREYCFVAYPGEERSLSERFRELMEYLLSKIDHENRPMVEEAYKLYQITLDDAYSLMDIRRGILEKREKNQKAEDKDFRDDQVNSDQTQRPAEAPEELQANAWEPYKKKKEKKQEGKKPKTAGNWFVRLFQKIREEFWADPLDDEEEFYMDETFDSSTLVERPDPCGDNPTVCLSNYIAAPEGLFLYEGNEDYHSMLLKKDVSVVGLGEEADLRLMKDTISRIHARITRENGNFILEDMNSTNGTFLNGNPLAYREKKVLQKNDIVRFADLKFRFV